MATTFDRLLELNSTQGPEQALTMLIETLRSEQNYHRLFDAMMLKQKYEMGLPLVRPTSLADVPASQRELFEKHYIDAAREVGGLFLKSKQLNEAWLYFRTIQEKEPVAAALEEMALPDDYEKAQELINVALYEGANPIRGLKWLLKTNGTCNTITTLDQLMPQLPPEDRKRAAALLARHLYDDLLANVQSNVQQRMPFAPPMNTLTEAIAGRDWLFQDGNYHIDVSHLNSVVRFSRFMDASCPELPLALQLADYGSHLDAQLQYQGEAPFTDFYPAHIQFFRILLGERFDEALAYFQQKLDAEPDESDKQMIAYALVDVLSRVGRSEQAMSIADKHLKFLDEQAFSFAELCLKSGRADLWADAAQAKGDVVGYAAAILSKKA